MVAIVADKESEGIGEAISSRIKKRGDETVLITTSGKTIAPCYGCNGCFSQSYEQCVVRDDMDEILPILIEAEIIVYISPLWCGCFSPEIKRILDKTALIGDRLYHVREKELYKGHIGKMRKIVGIAVAQHSTQKARDCFVGYMMEIAKILGIEGMAKVVKAVLDEEEAAGLEREILK